MTHIEKFNKWLTLTDDSTKTELQSLSEEEKYDRFYKDLEFGTGGLRGVIGAGTNRINLYTVKKATKGYAEYIKSNGGEACKKGVVIAHDNRRMSREFCLASAGVLAANGIKTYIFDSLRTTPELSFSVRELHAFGGIVITASHNPPEYNGYKLYDETGCQLVLRYTDQVIKFIGEVEDELNIESLTLEQAGSLIEVLDGKIDRKYYEKVLSLRLNPDIDKTDFKAVYSPQHGTGNIAVREVLKQAGFTVIPVESQCEPDPEFRGTKNPNPETKEAFEESIKCAVAADADIAITTDPDCDRLGVAVRHQGEYVLLTGNQSGAIILDYILKQKKANGSLPGNAVMISTIVTSDIGDRICEKYGVAVEKTLTGFKFIGDKIREHEEKSDKQFIFGYEESYGCLIGDFVRDKDAVQASLMLCEAAVFYRSQGKTLVDVLGGIYKEFGYYKDFLVNKVFKGESGANTIKEILSVLRKNPPTEIGGIKVRTVEDYLSDEMLAKGYPKSDVLKFILEDKSFIAVRPSGTEPKCKYYYCITGKTEAEAEEKFTFIRKTFE